MSLYVHDVWVDDERVGVRVDDGVIAALGPDVEQAAGDELLDGAGMVLLPGLVNGHTHAAMTLFRGFGDDLPLMEWLEHRIWPVEAKLTADDVYWGTRLACVEMIRTGTVHFWDMYWQPEAVARAVDDSGLRAAVALPLIDAMDEARAAAMRADALRSLDALDATGDRIRASLGPHAIYTVSEASLRWIAEQSAERDLPVQIHCSETEDEVTNCAAAHGVRPVEYLDRLGLLSSRTLLAHGVWFDDHELELVGERGATVVLNPVSNLKLAVGGELQYAKARAQGVAIGLGTDGAASNNSLDLFQDVKFLALSQKQFAADPAAMPASEAWAVATGQRAPLLGQPGRLAVGEPGDFLLVSADRPELVPGDLTANLVYAASGAVVDTTVVAGRVLMRGGVIDGTDEVRAKAVEAARRLGIA